ncbi:hypothetical protein Moror_12039 [Moniliophthora roreri MCA 2997]|uniref:Uncharacterized protein n=1 Tax=Moniliophthora roreri (strain MCA 2997) TaxID=1381753 RepID=V2WPY7_MONRO|nr:hypothetical protein Moror_12039 [Moniliophthora roreri MCA 2997]
MTDRPGEFWKNNKTNLLLARDKEAEKISWGDFIEAFGHYVGSTNEAFQFIAKQMGYNNAAQIEAFKQGLPRNLMWKIMTQPEGKLVTIKALVVISHFVLAKID